MTEMKERAIETMGEKALTPEEFFLHPFFNSSPLYSIYRPGFSLPLPIIENHVISWEGDEDSRPLAPAR